MTRKHTIILVLIFVIIGAIVAILWGIRFCGDDNGRTLLSESGIFDSNKSKVRLLDKVNIRKEIDYISQYTLEDVYPYQDTTRRFQWDKIEEKLTFLINAERKGARWGMLRNYRNTNGRAPNLAHLERDEYGSYVDEYGVPQYQAAPLYDSFDANVPVRYGRDGLLVRYISDSLDKVLISAIDNDSLYVVPSAYFMRLKTDTLNSVIVADRTNQNITYLEREGDDWLVRSMTYATTGLRKPPYQRATPVGIFVVQGFLDKMYYTHDGAPGIAGYAPYATRFTRGAYVHGVPLTDPNATRLIEYSPTLGTTPRSHMCVRTVTSHAKYLYDRVQKHATLVIVLD